VISIVGNIVIFLISASIHSFFTSFIVRTFFSGLLFALQLAATYGIIRTALGQTQGITPNPGYAWKMDDFVTYFVTSLLVGLAVGVGLVLCVIPGVILWFLLFFAPYYVLDKHQSPGEAMKSSIDLVRNNVGGLIGFLLVAGLIMFIGALCCIGVLIAYPVAMLAAAFVFKRINGETVVA
jgi:uncharacterized membrane protein